MIGRSDHDYPMNKLLSYGMTHFGFFWRTVNAIPPLARWVNRRLINRAVQRTASRPNAFSTLSGYTSWESLTDRTWFGRHLPPSSRRRPPLPPVENVTALFDRARRRPDKPVESAKSTLLFASFAQWFTDGFLLTDPGNKLKTHTNHEIDFSALYGLTKAETDCLRLRSSTPGRRGRLKSQLVNGEEYAPYYYDAGGVTPRPEFAPLRPPLHLPPHLPAEKRGTIFAFGGERANTTPQTAMLNTLFLREHNRLAGLLEHGHPDWDDERVFQTARNVVVVLLIKIVVEEYINHISPYHFRFLADPWAVWTADWNRANWIAVEFNLLYRWHSLMPTAIEWPGGCVPVGEWVFNNAPLTAAGLAAAFTATSRQKACALGLFNTPTELLYIETASVEHGRAADLGTYNEYRIAFGFPPAETFEHVSDDPDIRRELEALYGEPDNIEFFVGLFAENARPNAAVMALIGRFVAVDAFSQALTNPLLSPRVFHPATFDQVGSDAIAATNTLEDILRRNVAAGVPPGSVTMTQSREA